MCSVQYGNEAAKVSLDSCVVDRIADKMNINDW